MFAGRASFGAPSRTRVFLSGLTRASLEYMGRECAPFHVPKAGLEVGRRMQYGDDENGD